MRLFLKAVRANEGGAKVVLVFMIEKMTASHWEGVRAVYREGLATGEASFRTEVPEWEFWDGSHLRCCRLVALEGETVAGWAALSPVSSPEGLRGRGGGERLRRRVV